MKTRSLLLLTALLPALLIGLLIVLLVACSPSASDTVPPACDDYSFFSGFMREPRVSVEEIKCRKVGGDGLPQVATYTVYKTARTTVAYWANSRPINVSGEAPPCVLSRYTEQYPAANFDALRDCQTVTITAQPLTDGADCDDDTQCVSGLCIPMMPISPHGVCYGASMKTCERSLSPTAWARLTCRALGFTVSVCPRETERCILAPNPTGERYPYQCCETTLFE